MPFYTMLPDREVFTFSLWPRNLQQPQTVYCFRITQPIDTPCITFGIDQKFHQLGFEEIRLLRSSV